MKFFSFLFLLLLPILCLGKTVSEREAVAAIRQAVTRLGIADEFDESKATVSLIEATEPSYLVRTPSIMAYCSAEKGRVTQVVRIQKMLSEPMGGGEPVSDSALQRKALEVLSIVDGVPENYRIERKLDRHVVELGFFTQMNGFQSRFGLSVVTLDQYSGEFLSVATTVQDDVYESTEGVLNKAQLESFAFQAANTYVKTLPPDSQGRLLPLPTRPVGIEVLYGNNRAELEQGKKVRTLICDASFGEVNVTIDAKTGRYLWGAIARNSDSQSVPTNSDSGSVASSPSATKLGEPPNSKAPNSGPNLPVIGGVIVAVGLGVAALVRLRRG
jgi:hypothetical protein